MLIGTAIKSLDTFKGEVQPGLAGMRLTSNVPFQGMCCAAWV